MRLLILGDICGGTGLRLVKERLALLRERWALDWVVANAENTSGGTGLSVKHRDQLLQHGVDLITGGNHFFARPDWPEMVGGSPRVLRPHNLGGDEAPGRGWAVLEAPGKPPLAVVNLAGRVFMDPADCPFRWADTLLTRVPAGVPVIVDLHAEATSEKIALAHYLDGRAALVVGTHTHVQTSDERILAGGTGALTDLGMTGPADGVLGIDRETVVGRFVKGWSERFTAAEGPGVLEGLAADLDGTGKPTALARVRLREGEEPEAGWPPRRSGA